MSEILSVNNLIKRYGDFTAVDGISFSIAPGEIFGFLGVNGAGKTTTLRMLAGVLKPTSGEIVIAGHDLARDPIEAKRITGYIPDRPYLYAKLTGREFLIFVSELYEIKSAIAYERIDSLLSAYGLGQWQDELIESYSHGMKQRLATCSALVHAPKLLIVDEPMVGLDPHGARLLKDSFRGYAKAGMSILLSTHSLNVAEELCDRLVIINRGKIITSGTLAEIRAAFGMGSKDLEKIFLELTSSGNELAAS